MSPATAFISGPIEPWDSYFSSFYEARLVKAISANHGFVMGPAPGIDTIALNFLIDNDVHPSRITVYLAIFEDRTRRPHLSWFEELGGKIKVEGATTGDRDAAMTRDSDYDVLRCMTIEEQKDFYGDRYYPRVSATERNQRRRLGLPMHTHPEIHVPEFFANRSNRARGWVVLRRLFWRVFQPGSRSRP